MRDFQSFYRNAVHQHALLVILGSQGSGTNLLARFLQNLYGYAVVRDRSLVFDAAVRVHGNPTPAAIRRELTHVRRSLFPGPIRRRLQFKHYHHQGRFFAGLERELDRVSPRTAEEFAYFFYAYFAHARGCARMAIKSDDIWEHGGAIDRILPQVRFVLLVRDPRDNVLSIIDKPFGPRDVYAAALYVRKRLDEYVTITERHAPDVLCIRYETLLTDPHSFVDQFSRSFGLEPLDDVEAELSKLNVRAGNHGKWRTAMSARDLELCEWVLGPLLDRFGYVRGSSPIEAPSAFERGLRHARDIGGRVPQKLGAMARNLLRQ